jgi:predicted N-acetyltransferase YhbS
MTLERIHLGTCFVAIDDHHLVGTVMLYPPDPESECELYRQPGVYHFGKFAVDPDRQGEGIGKMLYDSAEARAKAEGAVTLACDTAAPAIHLIGIYEGWGYQIVGTQNWSMTNYESVVMAKALVPVPSVP